MKKFLFSILILSFFVSLNYAQSDSKNKEDNEFYCKALKQYLVCLDHHNEGVVESTIIQLMKLRRECADISYQKTIERLEEIETNGRTANIRLLAFIASRYLQNPKVPGLFKNIKIEDDEQLITMLLDRLE
jgi:hypothetical protein